ncbi:hypothetical protein [Nocardia abscessus]|uniref:hypothetical protein n=1 Tax=Nocardia abscessus TaxID=120957 RepID=UPI002456918F|nr:hypothetical protein [Nocardia abscessus]
MTLIQTLVTPNHILQVSDRRLTRANGSVFDDSHNKAVSWCGDFALGFTGLAFIDRAQRKPVSEWIAETLCDVSEIEDGVEKLRKAAEESIAQLPPWPDKRLTIAMTGFFDVSSSSRESATFIISNWEHNDTVWSTHRPEFYRTIHYYPSDPNLTYYVRSGALLNQWQHRVVRKRIFSVAYKTRDWNRVLRLMVALQRNVSDENGTVGRDAMVISLPKNPASRGTILTDVASRPLCSPL